MKSNQLIIGMLIGAAIVVGLWIVGARLVKILLPFAEFEVEPSSVRIEPTATPIVREVIVTKIIEVTQTPLSGVEPQAATSTAQIPPTEQLTSVPPTSTPIASETPQTPAKTLTPSSATPVPPTATSAPPLPPVMKIAPIVVSANSGNGVAFTAPVDGVYQFILNNGSYCTPVICRSIVKAYAGEANIKWGDFYSKPHPMLEDYIMGCWENTPCNFPQVVSIPLKTGQTIRWIVMEDQNAFADNTGSLTLEVKIAN